MACQAGKLGNLWPKQRGEAALRDAELPLFFLSGAQPGNRGPFLRAQKLSWELLAEAPQLSSGIT